MHYYVEAARVTSGPLPIVKVYGNYELMRRPKRS